MVSQALSSRTPSSSGGHDDRRSGGPTPAGLLRAHPVLGQLPVNVIDQLSAYVTRRRVHRGASIFAKGDPGGSLMGVLYGSVRISVPTLEGREVVLNLAQPGEIFGEMALLDGQPRSADATAAEDCELMVIERRDFIPVVHSRPEVSVKLIEILCARLRRTNEQVEDIMFLGLPVRLAKLLLELVKANETNSPPEKLSITQRELSEMIGVSRESTNRQLRAWQERKWVRLAHGTLTVLDARALSRIVDEQGDAD